MMALEAAIAYLDLAFLIIQYAATLEVAYGVLGEKGESSCCGMAADCPNISDVPAYFHHLFRSEHNCRTCTYLYDSTTPFLPGLPDRCQKVERTKHVRPVRVLHQAPTGMDCALCTQVVYLVGPDLAYKIQYELCVIQGPVVQYHAFGLVHIAVLAIGHRSRAAR